MIKNIVFDLNRTLVKVNYKKFFKVLNKLNIEIELFAKIFSLHHWNYNLNRINTKELFKNTLKDLKIEEKYLMQIKTEYEKNIIPVRGIKGILKTLKGKYRLLVLAGDGKEFLELKINKLGFGVFFKEVYASCHEGYLKKDVRLYKRLIKKSGIKPNESLFIDDTPLYVEIAKKLGFKTILFKDSRQLKEDLKKFKIKILDTQTLHNMAVFEDNIIRDPLIIIDSVYINRFLIKIP